MLNNYKIEILKQTSENYNNDSIKASSSTLKNLFDEAIQLMLESEISAYLGYEYHDEPNKKG